MLTSQTQRTGYVECDRVLRVFLQARTGLGAIILLIKLKTCVLLVRQQKVWYIHVYVVTRQKAKIFFTLYCFVVEPTSVLQIDFNLERNFFNEIVRVASSTKACELTE